MRVLVCGGRHYADEKKLFETLSRINITERITCIINGGAPGADFLSTLWAIRNKTASKSIPAKWKDLEVEGAVIKTGRFGDYNCMAGFTRNQKMIDEEKIDLVVAFPGGMGTADMVNRAREANVHVVRGTKSTFNFSTVKDILEL